MVRVPCLYHAYATMVRVPYLYHAYATMVRVPCLYHAYATMLAHSLLFSHCSVRQRWNWIPEQKTEAKVRVWVCELR